MTSENEKAMREAKRTGALELPGYPLRVQVGLTARCNLDCVMCHRIREDYPVENMPWELWERIRPTLKYARNLIFGFPGDPLVYPRIEDVLGDIQQFPDLHKVLVTNGKRLSTDRILDLVENSVDQIGISLEGITPESYLRTRRGGDFTKLVRALTRLDTERVKLVLKTIPLRHNLDELPGLIDLAVELGAKHVAAQHLICKEGEDDVYAEYAIWDMPEKWNEVEAECRERAAKHGLSLNFPGPLVDHGEVDGPALTGLIDHEKERFINPDSKCYEPWEYGRYGPTNAGGCCHISHPDFRDYDSILDLLNAPELQAIRATVNHPDQGMWHPSCRTCQRRMKKAPTATACAAMEA
jgi:MoaA/NifB/PqqE/SkfB family radical SAM enzyme